jgi:DNA-binding beta-propeller fold protein YncE
MLIVLASCGGSGGSSSGGGSAIYTTQNNNVTTIAGTAGVSGSVDDTAAAARFYNPCGITTYGTNLYVADTYNSTIRKIVIATGAVTTIAGTALSPLGITTDGTGTNLYVTVFGNQTVCKIDIATQAVTTIAGAANNSGSHDDTGTAATFNGPAGITITPDGTNLYVADFYNCTIRKIVIATGAVTTIAGTAGVCWSAVGIGAAAGFKGPIGITITPDGTNLYVADSFNYTVRKIVIATGAVTTIAGTAGLVGSADGTGAGARFYHPYSITTDGTSLYVADAGNNTIRKIVIASGDVRTVAGTPGNAGSADGIGAAAAFNSPQGIATDGTTNLYVADSNNSTIRKIY